VESLVARTLASMSNAAPLDGVRLFVMDLDNTVWDWFHAWVSSFSALLEGLEETTGISRADLEREIRPIHQAHQTSEYSWLLEDMASLAAFVGPGESIRDRFDEAVHRQNSVRLRESHLYPLVLETLQVIRSAGVPVVAYTESLAYWTEWRIKRLGLEGVVDVLYSSPDHDLPSGKELEDMRMLPSSDYGLKQTVHKHVPWGVVKPDPVILMQIIEEHDVPNRNVLYVGDSLMKDVAMAQAAGVIDVHAKYGEFRTDPRYPALQRVSHWPDWAIEMEHSANQRTPHLVLDKGFHQLLEFVNFGES
jgi:phosphoglycolate phosphatase-like HAD superfamily hydrolase